MDNDSEVTLSLRRDMDGDSEFLWSKSFEYEEMASGFLASGLAILAVINNSQEIQGINEFLYFTVDNGIVYDNILLEDKNSDYVNETPIDIIPEGYYGLWVRSTQRYSYDLYSFKTAKFIQGLITACSNFKVDFRDYIKGLMYDKEGKKYTLDNHIMTYGGTLSVAIDLNDIEEEEKDNENINLPLDKDY